MVWFGEQKAEFRSFYCQIDFFKKFQIIDFNLGLKISLREFYF